jgi:tripartite-type tricarboxylate transporter receptor subunit TctC
MSISRRSLLATLAAGPLATVLTRPAFAAYPEHAVRFIVPFAAGGNADAVARLLGESMSPSLGQSVVIENRTGAGGSLGAQVVASAAPDGYTLLMGSNGPLTVNPFVQAKLGYDPLKDFAPIGLVSATPHSIVLHDSVPAKTLSELIELSKKQQVTIGTSGVGSATHLTLARFNAQTGAKLVHVPYRGGGALIPDTLAGNINGAMTEMSTLLAQHKKGKVHILVVASAKRVPQLPDVPTMIESGVKDFVAASYVGLLAPAKTSPDVIATLNKSLVNGLSNKTIQERYTAIGAEIAAAQDQTPEGFAAYIKKEYDNSKAAAEHAGLKPQ